jgi:hypothetical protein
MFFAILIHISLVKKPKLWDYWSTVPILQSSYTTAIGMSRDRFLSILVNRANGSSLGFEVLRDFSLATQDSRNPIFRAKFQGWRGSHVSLPFPFPSLGYISCVFPFEGACLWSSPWITGLSELCCTREWNSVSALVLYVMVEILFG